MTKKTATVTVVIEQLLLARPRAVEGGREENRQKAAHPCTISQTQTSLSPQSSREKPSRAALSERHSALSTQHSALRD